MSLTIMTSSNCNCRLNCLYFKYKDVECVVGHSKRLKLVERTCEKEVRVLTHQKPPRRFCMLFVDVLPFTTLASSVNGKTSKKSMQKRRGGFLVWQGL